VGYIDVEIGIFTTNLPHRTERAMGDSDSGSEGKERRRHPRKKTFSLVSFVQKDGEADLSAVVMGRTLNISASGIRLESIEPIAVGTALDMEIALGNQVFSLLGTVVYCRKIQDELYMVGIRFQETSDELSEVVE
jgi:hypothetical protein